MEQTGIPDIGGRRELFVDRWVIDHLECAEMRLHAPTPAGPALRLDAPWEGAFAFYTTVIQEGGRYLMYYRGWPGTGEGHAAVTCMAVSPDGIRWEKPRLGLVEEGGSRDNNIILHERADGSVCHNFAPFLDARPGVPEGERFKGLGGSHRAGGLFGYVSPDGARWRRIQETPLFGHDSMSFDSQNVAFWSEAEERYVCYYRTFHPAPGAESRHGWRWVSRRTSDDFQNWSAPVEMDPGGAPWEEIYVQQTHPYFRAPHIYIAPAARFMPMRLALTEEQGAAAGIIGKYFRDSSDTVLMTSRGGNAYDRTFMESFIRPGMGHEHWGSRTNYAATGIVPTGPAEMSLYVNRRYAQPEAYVERMTLRPDGIASVRAPFQGAEMLTRRFTFTGRELEINFSASAAGGIRVEIQDASGRPMPGFGLAEAKEAVGDELDRIVSWRGGADVSSLAGRPVRLRFVMKDADLYSFRFR